MDKAVSDPSSCTRLASSPSPYTFQQCMLLITYEKAILLTLANWVDDISIATDLDFCFKGQRPTSELHHTAIFCQFMHHEVAVPG